MKIEMIIVIIIMLGSLFFNLVLINNIKELENKKPYNTTTIINEDGDILFYGYDITPEEAISKFKENNLI